MVACRGSKGVVYIDSLTAEEAIFTWLRVLQVGAYVACEDSSGGGWLAFAIVGWIGRGCGLCPCSQSGAPGRARVEGGGPL